MAQSWLNPDLFHRTSEVMFQGYYQAHLDAGAFFRPAISYIPTPDASALLERAWAVTFRFYTIALSRRLMRPLSSCSQLRMKTKKGQLGLSRLAFSFCSPLPWRSARSGIYFPGKLNRGANRFQGCAHQPRFRKTDQESASMIRRVTPGPSVGCINACG
jgi:hypothetical protein